MLLLASLLCLSVHAADGRFVAVVAEPFLELHTGPGRGFPVFHVVDRGDRVEVIKRRTDWFLVRTGRGKDGWVPREAMAGTVTPSGRQAVFAEPGMGDFSERRWEAGLLGGDFEGAEVMSVYGAYAFTPNLFGELAASQVFGNHSDSWLAVASLVAQPFPKWRLSPFFALGTGLIYTDPKATVVDEDDRTDQIGSAGGGVRWYVTRRFILRAEYRRHVIFEDTDDNQEVDEWKAGAGFFF